MGRTELPARVRVRLNEEAKPKPGPRVRLHDKPRKKAKANRMLLTEEKVAALPGKASVYDVWDAGGRCAVRGLCVQVLPSGTKTYRYSFRFKGAPQAISYKLGRWPGLSLEEARAKAVAAEKVVVKGQDPRVADPANSDTFSAIVDEWHTLEQVGRLKNKSAEETRQFVQRLCKALERRPVGEITYRDIDTLLAKVRDVAGTPATAIRLHAHLRTIFRWCARTERIEKSPIADMPSPAPEPKPRERDWFKRDAADPVIKKLWAFANEVGGDRGKFIKLLLITGKRRNAIISMRFDDIDADWFWTPPVGSKHKRNTPIPLPKLAQRVLGPRPESGGTVLRLHEGDMVELAKQVQKHVEPTYFHHGLRHVVATKLAELKVPPHIARLLLDHAAGRQDAHAGYEHVDWRPEMTEALEAWCAYIERLVTPAEGVAVLR